jgi:uncharacterized membrane protein YedE/YeeE
MSVNWLEFTPWASLAGGLLIGLAAAVFILFSGRIAGVSGILGGLLLPSRGDAAWRVAFLAGLMLSPAIYRALFALPEIDISASLPVLVIAGLLVGFGTRLGSGCTSGHGVCGLSRLSPRSLVATLVFMAAGLATVFMVRHVIAWGMP